MLSILNKRIRKWIARLFPGRFPGLYSTWDDPVVVPLQEAAYQIGLDIYIRPDDRVLDVGFGLGYGLRMMAKKSVELVGIEIDRKAVKRAQQLSLEVHSIRDISHYDGVHIPYPDGDFDVVTCIDVIEHVPDYLNLLEEMVRVSRRVVLISTPNRRPEFTLPNGRPRNRWHLREWSYKEFDHILNQVAGVGVEWNFLDGPWEGPVRVSSKLTADTMSLVPALLKDGDAHTSSDLSS